ncbi:putative membrane-associated kinase regulator 6 [Bidens hawaiensis]|uniref:putative membrane-associated kinase regulator 6 n=1 Tax=Bidens hawaiensis TaxID=980011 RepID=UPI00404AB3B1
MEDSQPLSVESFSYTWLVNQNHPPLDGPNRSFRLSFDGASFIEMDPNLTPSKRFLVNKDFDFNVPKSQPHVTLVHADKLISNGILVPLKSYSNLSIPVPPLSSSSREEGRFRKSRSVSLSKCNKLQKTIIQKYMDLVRPLWYRIRRGRSSSSRVQGVENRGPGSRTSGVCWGARCCDSERSIHEAVVRCKKTIGMD